MRIYQRRYRLLKKNEKVEFPSHFIFLDVETKIINEDFQHQEHQMDFLWSCYYHNGNKEYKLFNDKEEFGAWVVDKSKHKTKLVIISSNIWFDFFNSGLYHYLLREKWVNTNRYISSRTNIFSFKKDNMHILLLNLQNFIPASIKQIGDVLNLPKLDIDLNNCSIEERKTYCRRDLDILVMVWEKWQEFIRENNLGSFGKTLASQCFNAFRHRFLTHQIYIHNHKPTLGLERNAYFGGRTECFFIGKKQGETFYLLDINSFYPFIMQNYRFPIKFLFYSKVPQLLNIKERLKDECIVAKVLVDYQQPLYCIRQNKKVVFPIGQYITYTTSIGLMFGLNYGVIKEVYEVAVYNSGYIFKDYINFFFEKRKQFKKENNKVFDLICKLYMNSLYGKFGQRSDETKWERETDDSSIAREYIYDMTTDEHSVYTRFAYKEDEVILSKLEAFSSFPAIAAHVTEYGRFILWNYIQKAGSENVLYCDTDSLLVNQQGFENLKEDIDEYELGKLKLDGIFDDVEIRGCKDYRFNQIEKIKGIRKDADKLNDSSFQQVQFPSFLQMIKDGENERYVIKKVNKNLKREYDKGLVLPNGRVQPFKLYLST